MSKFNQQQKRTSLFYQACTCHKEKSKLCNVCRKWLQVRESLIFIAECLGGG